MSTSTVEPASGWAVEGLGLRKTYRTRRGRQVAVADLDLRVPAGGVHGFLGPNGSGKTTTIRMLLGLINADAGRMRVFDTEVPHHLPAVVDRIGAIVEQPKFFPAFSGRKNLQLLAQAIGTDRSQVGRVLEEVGLADRGRSKYRTYSLGMKQRLAIAATLLKDPDLLIFDEPTNGLDPAGIHEIRATMRSLADRGKTVLVSSHILSEVQLVADTVTIIGRGRLLAEGTVSDILTRGARAAVRVGVSDPGRAAAILGRAGFAVEPGPDQTLTVSVPAASGDAAPLDPAQITEALARESLYVRELVPFRADLEQVFLALTAEEHLGSDHPGGYLPYASPAAPAPRAPSPPAAPPLQAPPARPAGDQPTDPDGGAA
jgi:ABC-type multidrug transport system ATPase subunit